MTKLLADYAQGRNNNFNLIRFIAAFAVLLTHTFALVTGNPQAEPLRSEFGISLGTIAVDIFFITSGYLVTASLLNRQSLAEFIWARVLRIYPALWVMLFITFLVSVVVTKLPVAEFLSNYQVAVYFIKCATLLAGVAYDLPGVFDTNPYKSAVNGSLWTMPYELRMYLMLAGLWVFIGLLAIKDKVNLLRYSTLILAVLSFATILWSKFVQGDVSHNRFPELLFMFFSGASFYCFRSSILLSGYISALAILLLALSALFMKAQFEITLWLVIGYLLFYLAYVPAGFLRSFNKLGDYSYGIYIYAFPVQQLTVMSYPKASVETILFISGFVTMVLAVFSWHYIEKPTLALKAHFMQIVKFGKS